jgi:hypothetical protein
MKNKVFFYCLVIFSLVSVFAIAQDEKGKLSRQSKSKNESSVVSNRSVERNDIPKELSQGGSVVFIINDKPVSKEEYMNHMRGSAQASDVN